MSSRAVSKKTEGSRDKAANSGTFCFSQQSVAARAWGTSSAKRKLTLDPEQDLRDPFSLSLGGQETQSRALLYSHKVLDVREHDDRDKYEYHDVRLPSIMLS